MELMEINVLVLAYLGDTVYENYIRRILINQKINNVNDLQKKSIEYVSAKKQFVFIKNLIDEDFFNEEELSVIRRARNFKSSSHPKNCDIISYKYATALEAIIGYLTLKKEDSRVLEIMERITGEKVC